MVSVFKNIDPKAYSFGDATDAGINSELQTDIARGLVKVALLDAYRSSSEKHTKVWRKPSQKVTVTTAFKTGSMTLVALSNHVGCGRLSKPSSIPQAALVVGEFLANGAGDKNAGFIKPHLVFPKPNTTSGFARKDTDAFRVAYWAIGSDPDPSKVNVVKMKKTIIVKAGGTQYEVNVPIVTNTKPLAVGDEVVVQSWEAAGAVDDEGPTKKQRLDGVGKGAKGTPSGVGKGSANGKAKGKSGSKSKGKSRGKSTR